MPIKDLQGTFNIDFKKVKRTLGLLLKMSKF